MNASNPPTATGTEPSGKVRLIRIHEDREGQRLDNFLFGILKGAPKSLIY
jgi:23S rRNA pseudouridine955/2504/2580 synthase